MPRPGVDYETSRDWLAAQHATSGAVPTVAQLIRALGGSATTQAKHKRRFLEELRETDPTAPLPDVLTGVVQQGAQRLWEELTAALGVQETAVLEAGDARIREALAAQQAAEATREAALENARALQARIQALESTIETQAAELAHMRHELVARGARLNDLGTALASARTEAHERAVTIATQAAELQRAAEAYNDVRADSAAREARAQHELKTARDAYAGALAALQARLDAAEAQATTLADQREAAIEAGHTTALALASTEAQLAAARQAEHTLAQRLDEAQRQLTQRATEFEGLSAALTALQAQQTLREQSMTAWQNERAAHIEALRGALESAQGQLAVLRGRQERS